MRKAKLHQPPFILQRSCRSAKDRTLRILAIEIMLDAALVRLSDIMLSLVLRLLLAVPREARGGASDGALHAVADATREVARLALGLLAAALLVLTDALVLEAVGADESSDRLLGGADGLVPRSLRAVRVVGRDGAGADVHGADLADGVGGVVLDVGFGLGVLALALYGVSMEVEI